MHVIVPDREVLMNRYNLFVDFLMMLQMIDELVHLMVHEDHMVKVLIDLVHRYL